jgi:hypothetical protein
VVIALRALLATLPIAGIGLGCGDPPARVQLVPVQLANPACGRPFGANAITITAYGTSAEKTESVALDEAVDLADFPDTTTQLGVEVLIGGGAVGASGKTLPLVFGDLATGTEIPIVMAPPGGFCPVGPLGEARKNPLVALAGDGVLVVGGLGAGGPLSTAELYDPRTGTFEGIEIPLQLRDDVDGLAGAVLATMPDGRVVLTGGSRGLLAVFDPAQKAFGATFAIAPQRAFHGAIAVDATHVLVAGGCHGVVGQTCDATPLRSTFIYDLEGNGVPGPNLTIDAVSEGGQLLDTGGAFVLIGGFGTPNEAQRFTLDSDATKLVGVGAQSSLLDGQALLAAFETPVMPAPNSTMVTPDGSVVGLAAAPGLVGARMITLEDGSALAIGGDPVMATPHGDVARVAHYRPTSDLWEQVLPTPTPFDPGPLPVPNTDQPGELAAPALVRLPDGTILVLGGEAAPSANAWIYRPSLVGPATGSLTADPSNPTNPSVLTASDPRTLTRPPMQWVLSAPAIDDTLTARALLGGPRLERGSIKVTVNVDAGGFALIAQQVAPDRALVAHLVPGELARLEQLGTGTVCTGSTVELPAGAVVATLVVDDGVSVKIGDAVVLSCSHRAAATGAWGIAASGAGARIAVANVTVAR